MYFFIISYFVFLFLGVIFFNILNASTLPLISSASLFFSSICILSFELKSIPHKKKFLVWYSLVIISSYSIEFIGVKYGVPFGNYFYFYNFQPQIYNVPVVIPLAWATSILLSVKLSKSFLKIFKLDDILLLVSLISGLLITIYDFTLERIASKLLLWTFVISEGIRSETLDHRLWVMPPWNNYFSWFLFTFICVVFSGKEIRPNKLEVILVMQMLFFVALSLI
jgi:uncharacterized membrane protein